MAIPILRRVPKATKATPAHIDGAVYQFGRAEVVCRQNTATVTIDPARDVAWVRATIHELDATTAVASPSDLFTAQFSGGAPRRGSPPTRCGRRRLRPGTGP